MLAFNIAALYFAAYVLFPLASVALVVLFATAIVSFLRGHHDH